MSTAAIAAVNAVAASAPFAVEGREFYDGSVEEQFAHSRIARIVGETGKGYRVNLARRVVDAVLDRIKIASVSVPENPEATAMLQILWTGNRLGSTVKEVNRLALSEGESFLSIWEGEEDGSVQINHRTAVTTKVFYDPENPFRKTHAAFVWEENTDNPAKKVLRVTLLYADRIERWVTKPGLRADRPENFVHYLKDDEDDEDWLIENPYGEVPVFHFRTGFTPRPEHADAFGPQNAINKLVASQMTTIDYTSFPQRYRLRAAKLKDGDNAPLPGYPSDDVDIDPSEADEPEDKLESGPGTVWDLSDTEEVGQFNAADPKVFLDPINAYARIMGTVTATPLRFMDPTGDMPSGESLRADDAPLVNRIYDRQTWLGDEWRAALRFALKVAGTEVDTVALAWQPVQVIDDKEGWDNVQAKIDAGVPREVALIEAGRLPEEVAKWSEDGFSTNIQTRIAQLVSIAEATSKLGQAVALGVLDTDRARSLIDDLIGDAEQSGQS